MCEHEFQRLLTVYREAIDSQLAHQFKKYHSNVALYFLLTQFANHMTDIYASGDFLYFHKAFRQQDVVQGLSGVDSAIWNLILVCPLFGECWTNLNRRPKSKK